ncbi:MAG: Gfo/Idh/MocA family oxidoreductase, partial [Chloroflexi bacterium]|nr:Gfo/Idh/MocA family oxidoreductase [Chloroflexota bacterium]
MTLRVAVVGLGHIGRQHTVTYAGDSLSELVGVCDMDATRAGAIAAQVKVPAYYDLAELLRKERPDVLSVATSGPENGGHHFAPTMQALASGVHVICEKPLSNNLSEAKQMVATARERGLYLAVDLNHRFTPATRLAKERQLSGDLGELLFIDMHLWIRN